MTTLLSVLAQVGKVILILLGVFFAIVLFLAILFGIVATVACIRSIKRKMKDEDSED